MGEKIKGFFLYDGQGRPYRFDDETEVSARRVTAKEAPGFAIGEGKAPANWESIAQGGNEAGGRHLGSSSPDYHLYWERGPLFLNRPDLGYVGVYSCVHRHVSLYSSLSYIDWDYDIWEW